MKDLQLLPLSNIHPISKSEIEEYRNEIAKGIESGSLSALKLKSMLKFYDYLFNGDDKKENGLNHLIQKEALKEFHSFNDKDVSFFGLTIQEAEVGVKYDYSGDKVWSEINEELTKLKERLKARETLLKNVPKPDFIKGIRPMIEVDQETGEAIELLPPTKTSSTTLKMTFKK